MKLGTKDKHCPCGSGLSLANCCQPYIQQQKPAPTAESLMRSRFSAYTLQNFTYILASWHPTTRPDISALEKDSKTKWIRLKIIQATDNTVEFKAYFKIQGKAHHLHECSRFLKIDEHWYYVDGIQDPV